MRFEDRPDEQKFKDAYRALGELRIALRAIAYRQPNDHDRSTLDWIAESHLGVIEQLVKSEHMDYLRKAPPPRLLVTDEDQRRDPKLREALARLPKAPEESTWQAEMRKAAEEDDEFGRDLMEAMIAPIRLEPPPLPPAVIRLLPGEPNTITLEEAHRRLREQGHDPADYDGVLIVPADVPMIDFGDEPEQKRAAADLATMFYRVGQRVTEDIYEKLRHELGPEHPADPTGVDSPERYESPEDQA